MDFLRIRYLRIRSDDSRSSLQVKFKKIAKAITATTSTKITHFKLKLNFNM